MHEVIDQILSYVKAAWGYRWYAVGAAWIVAIVGWIIVYKTPDRYEATARVFVELAVGLTKTMERPL